MHNSPARTLIDTQCGLKFARSPRWADQKLLFIDVHDRCIKSANMDGTVQTIRALPFLPGGFLVLEDGRFVVGDSQRRKIYLVEEAGLKLVADLSNLARFFPGDSVVACGNSIYVGDVGFDFMDPLEDPVPNGVIVHISPDGESSVVAGDLFFPSGMVVTPDKRTLIVAEKLRHRLTSFDIASDGSLKRRRVWAQFKNDINPDGICLDRGGVIWVAGGGACVSRVSEGGEIDRQVTTRQRVFSVALGGQERTLLFMCTSASFDPVITRRAPGGTIEIAEVDAPG